MRQKVEIDKIMTIRKVVSGLDNVSNSEIANLIDAVIRNRGYELVVKKVSFKLFGVLSSGLCLVKKKDYENRNSTNLLEEIPHVLICYGELAEVSTIENTIKAIRDRF